MKTNSRFARSMTALDLVAALALAALPSPGQANAQNQDPDPQTSRALPERAPVVLQFAEASKPKPESAATLPSRFDVDITDGTFLWKGKRLEATLENVIEMVRDRHEGANIVLSPALPRLRIANLKLRATGVEQELEALRVACGGRFLWTATPPLSGPVAGNDNPTPLYVLSPSIAEQSRARQVEVFNLTDYFNSLGSPDEDNHPAVVKHSLQQIQEIIAGTVQAMDADQSSSLGFQFHAGANLLVVSGTPEALEVARKVIAALGPQIRPPGMGGPGFGAVDPWGNPYGVAPPGDTLSAASSKARRAIMNKLEAIRLDSVGPWELPLSEAVKILNDEAKKRDPQKMGGINFLINPNPPEAAPGSPVAGGPAQIDPATGLPIVAAVPIEAIDINQVLIRFDLPLKNMRLVDVLDVMMKVAEQPIRYTITDYGVVFSLGRPESSMNETRFPGAAPGIMPKLP